MADPREINIKVLINVDQASAQQATQQVRAVGQQAGQAFSEGIKPAEDLTEKVNNAGTAAKDAALRFTILGESMSAGRILAVIAVYSVLHSVIGTLKDGIHTAWEEWLKMDTAMAKVAIATGAAGEELEAIGNRLEFIAASAEAGFQGSEDLAEGFAQLARAGFEGAQAMELLKQAGLAAQAGFTDIKTILDAAIPVLRAYGSEFENIEQVTDIFFKAQRLGGPEVSQFSGRMGTLVVDAQAVGVSAEDVAIHLTALTRATGSSSEAFAILDQMLRRLRQPTAELQDASVQVKETSIKQVIATEGLAGLFDVLAKASGGSADRLVDLAGSLRGSTANMLAQGALLQNLNKLYEEWGERGQAAGETQRNIAAVMETDAEQIRRMTAEFKELLQTMGGWLAGVVVPSITALREFGGVLGDVAARLDRFRIVGPPVAGDILGPRTREMLIPGTDETFREEFRGRMRQQPTVAPTPAPEDPAAAEQRRQAELRRTRDAMDQIIKGMTEQIDLLQRIDDITGQGPRTYQLIRDAIATVNQEISREEANIKAIGEDSKASEDHQKRLNSLQRERNDLMFREAQIAKDLAQEYRQAGDRAFRAREAFAAAQIREIMMPVELQSGLRNLRGEMIRGAMTRAEEADPDRVRRVFQDQRQMQQESFEAQLQANNLAMLAAFTQAQITDVLHKKHDILLQNARAQMELNRQEEEAIRNANIRAAQEDVARLQRRQEMMAQLGVQEGTVFGAAITPSQLRLQAAQFRAEFAQMTRQQIEEEFAFMQQMQARVTLQGTFEERLAFQQRQQAAQEALRQPTDLAGRQQDIFNKVKKDVADVDALIGESLKKQSDLAQKMAAGAYDAMLQAYDRIVKAAPQMGALAAQAWLNAFKQNLPAWVIQGFGPGPIPVRPGGAEGGTTIIINGIKVDLSEGTKEELKNAAVRAALAGAGDAAAQDEHRMIGGSPGTVVR